MASQRPAPASILVVDDEPEFREILAMTLATMNYRVFTAANGREAFDLLQKQSMDVVISDIRMPGGNGLELLNRTRDELVGSPPIILLVTGYDEVSTEDAYKQGADALFSKPFDQATLMRIVNRMLASPQPQPGQEPAHSDLRMNVRLDIEGMAQTIESQVLRLDRGGIFVSLPRGNMPNVNNAAHFSIDFDPNHALLEGNGVVRWVRKDAPGSPAGCGVEFTYLTESDRRRVIERCSSAGLPRRSTR